MRWLVAASLFVTATVASNIRCFTDNQNPSTEDRIDTEGITDFEVNLFRELSPANSTENFFFSPFSIWTALTLAYFGSSGNTEAELRRELGMTDKTSTYKTYKALQLMYSQRQINQTRYTFLQENKAYFSQELALKPCLPKILPEELETIDFRHTNEAAATINGFVSHTTKGRIPTIVTPDDLQDAVMVLVNAAFFKGSWKSEFKTSNTAAETFHISPHQTASVQMMKQTGQFRYGLSADLMSYVLELPYASDNNNTISMYVFLPMDSTEKGFATTLESLNGTTLRNAVNHNNLRLQSVEVHLPKFKMETTLEKELKQGLINLGIRDLFDGEKADLTEFNYHRRLSIGKAIHKGFVEVSEEGTEAAAATALISYVRFGHSRPPQPVVFNCNRPFVFIIYDNSKNTENVLFMGTHKKPIA